MPIYSIGKGKVYERGSKRKSKKWLVIATIIVAVLAIAGVVLGIVLGGAGGGNNGPTGVLNIDGGEVESDKLIAATAATNQINVISGTVSGAGISLNDGKLNITGGDISEIAGTAAADEIKISGKPVIGLLKQDALKIPVIVDELTEGASIKVRAEGVFTSNFANADAANAAKAFFSAVEDTYEIVIDSLALSCNQKAAA